MTSVLKPYPMGPFAAGLNKQDPAIIIPPQFGSDGHDVTFYRKVVRKRTGFEKLGVNTITGQVQRFADYFTLARAQSTMAMGPGGLFFLNDATNTWTSLSALAGVYTIVPSWEVYNGIFVYADGVNALRSWDGVAASTTNLVGTPPATARFLLGFGNHLIAGYPQVGPTVFPFRVMWTDKDNINQWATGDAAIVDFLETDDVITGLAKYGAYGVMLRQYSIWVIQVAAAPAIYRFDRVVDKMGCIAPGSVQVLPNGIAYLGYDGLLLFNGATAPSPVLEPLRNEVMGQLDFNQTAIITSDVDLVNGEYWMLWPTTGNTIPNRVLIYNYLEGHGSIHSFPRDSANLQSTTYFGIGRRLSKTPATRFSDLPLAFTAYNIPFSSGTTGIGLPKLMLAQPTPSAAPTQAVIASIVKADFDTSLGTQTVPISSSFTTRLDNFGSPSWKRVLRLQIICERQPVGATLTIEPGTSDDGNQITFASVRTLDMSAISATGSIWVETDDVPEALYHCVRVSNSQVNVDFGIIQIVFWGRERGAQA